MSRRLLTPFLLGAFIVLAACDALGPDRGNTRVVASAAGGTGASQALVPTEIATDRDHDDGDEGERRGGGAVLALVDGLEVIITAVQALPAEYLDTPTAGQNWETLTLATPVRIDLLDLPAEPLDGIELFDGDLTPGTYVRMRFLVSELNLTLAAPLRIGGHEFPAGEPLEIQLGNPWVQVPGAHFTVADDQTVDVHVVFDAGETFGRLIVRDGRLTLTPAFRGRGGWRD